MNSKHNSNNTDVEKLKVIVESISEVINKIAPEGEAAIAIARIEEFKNFRTSLNQESDRGSVLMAAAFIEDKVSKLIESYLVDNKKVRERVLKNNGPLATFSSKIDMAFLLGLIPENILNDLHILRKIRNEYAHNASSLTFETPSIKDRTKSLSVLGTTFLRDSTRTYFLRSMTTILTFINIKMESFERCTVEEDFDFKIFDESMQIVKDAVHKESSDM